MILPITNLDFNPGDIESSFSGHDRLVTAFTDFRLLIGDRVFPKVVEGKDGWFFFTAEMNVDDYQRDIPLSDKQLATIQQNIDEIGSYYASKGITLLVVIAPNKDTIYPQYMPSEIPVIGKESRLDQLVAYMHAHGKFQILDLRPALIEASKTRQVYYSTDSHWNDYGAYIAYSEILNSLHANFPQLSPHPLSDFSYVDLGRQNMDLAINIGSSMLTEQKFQLELPNVGADVKTLSLDNGRKITITSAPDPNLPTAVIYHDSFFFQVMPMLAGAFQHAVYIPHYTGQGIWDLSWVNDEKANIVIVEFAERYLHDIPRIIKP